MELDKAVTELIKKLDENTTEFAARIWQLAKERDAARANARILAHSYENDCRPPARVVSESLAYPVMSASPAVAGDASTGRVERRG